jgi:hypothetical protein
VTDIRIVLAAGMALAALVAGGCRTPAPTQTQFMREAGTVTISTDELRIRTTELADGIAGDIETASDSIRLLSDDRRTDENALIWKIRAVNMVHDAAFRPDPLVSMLDLWVLAAQLRDFAASEAGASFFGEHQMLAATTTAAIVTRVEEVVATVGTGERFEEARGLVATFAQNNPLEGRQLRRTSVAAAFAETTGLRAGSAFEAVGTLDRRAALLTAQLPFLTEFLPKQLAWQAELSVLQNAAVLREELRFGRLDGIEANLDRMAVSLEGVPDLVRAEREAAIGAAATEATVQREATLDAIDVMVDDAILILRDERDQVLAGITREREAATADVAALVAQERARILEDVERQRLETIATLQGEREQVLTDARVIAAETVSGAMDGARGLVWRGAALGGGLIGLGLVIGALVLRTGGRRG